MRASHQRASQSTPLHDTSCTARAGHQPVEAQVISQSHHPQRHQRCLQDYSHSKEWQDYLHSRVYNHSSDAGPRDAPSDGPSPASRWIAPCTPENSEVLYESRLDHRTDEEAPFSVTAEPDLARVGGVWHSAEGSNPTTMQERIARGWRGNLAVSHAAPAVRQTPQVCSCPSAWASSAQEAVRMTAMRLSRSSFLTTAQSGSSELSRCNSPSLA